MSRIFRLFCGPLFLSLGLNAESMDSVFQFLIQAFVHGPMLIDGCFTLESITYYDNFEMSLRRARGPSHTCVTCMFMTLIDYFQMMNWGKLSSQFQLDLISYGLVFMDFRVLSFIYCFDGLIWGGAFTRTPRRRNFFRRG